MATLEITFVGLGLFAPDPSPSPTAGGAAVHVLLPRYGKGDKIHEPATAHCHSPPKHYSRLIYDARLAHDRRPDAALCCVDLSGCSLDVFETLGDYVRTHAVSLDLPSDLTEIRKVAGVSGLEHVARSYVDPGYARPKPLDARVTLRAGHDATEEKSGRVQWTNECDAPAAPWTGPIATEITWRADGLPDTPITLVLRKLGNGKIRRTLRLSAHREAMHLYVYCSPKVDLPPRPAVPEIKRGRCFRADHFEGYYGFFPRAERVVLPGLVEPYTAPKQEGMQVTSECKKHGKEVVTLSGSTRIRTPDTQTCTPSRALVEPYRTVNGES